MKCFACICVAWMLLLGSVLKAQGYSPVSVTGFNIDAIAETAPNVVAGTTQTLDGTNHVMYSANFAAGAGFPGGIINSGTIVSGTNTYQLNPFTGNNALYVANGTTNSLTLATPASYASVSLLLFSTEGTSNITVSMTYTNGTTTSFGNFTVQDWFFAPGAVYCCFGRCTRVSSGSMYDGYPTDPRFYPLNLNLSCADQQKALQSITIHTNSGTMGAYIMAVSGVAYTQTITPVSANVTCFGAANGSATVTVSGSNAPYTYSWNTTPVQTSSVATGLSPGNYTCTITDSKSCVSTTTVSIGQAASAMTFTTAVSNASCTLSNGGISAGANGGATPYTYALNGGAFSPASSFSNLPAGNYTVQVKDANNCLMSAQQTITTTPVPTVSVNSGSVCTGTSMTLTASGAISYSWSPALGLSSSSGANVTATPPATTVYTVTGTDANSCSAASEATVVVSNNFILQVSPSASICPGFSTTVSASGATTYTWVPASGLNSASSGTAIASPASTTVYTVTGTNGGCTGTNTVQVTVNLTPTITIAPSTATICSGTNATLTVSGASTYTWSPATGLNTTTSATVSASPPVSTLYMITGTSPEGCKGIDSIEVMVVSTPTLQAISTPTIICQGASAVLSATGASNYTWSPAADLSSSTGASTTASPTVSTLYTLVGENNLGPFTCATTTTVQLAVIPSIVVTVTPSDSICYRQSMELYASGGNRYQWFPSAGLSEPNKAATLASPATTTTYSVVVSNNYVCPVTATVTVFVNPLPLVNGGPDTTINIDQSYVLRGNGTGTMGWSGLDGLPLVCNYCQVVEVMPKDNTCYMLRSTNSHGCVNSDTVCINVTKDWDVFVPNAFTPTGDGINDVFLPMGYGMADMDLYIYNRWGQQVFHGHGLTKGWDGTFGGNLCEPGMYVYLLSVQTMGGVTEKRTGHVTLLARLK